MSEDIKEEKKEIKVETFAGDMTQAIESIGANEGGFIKKIIHEEETNAIKKANISPESKRNKTFMSISFILTLLAVAAVVFIVVFRKEIATVSVAPQYKAIIFTDQNQFLEIGGFSKDQIIQTLVNEESATKVKEGGAEGIYLTNNKKVVGRKEFFSLLKTNTDESQLSFIEDNFLLGVTNLKNEIDASVNKNLFILLKMRSFTDVFGGMRAWESKMFTDLHGLFGVDLNADTKYLLTKDFEDGIVVNKNARILYDKDGQIVMMYVYANDTSLIITNSKATASEIMTRLSASQVKK